MHTVYGAPLPPSVEASTKGELRIRIDRLVLDDAAVNHNPLVQLGDGTAAALAQRRRRSSNGSDVSSSNDNNNDNSSSRGGGVSSNADEHAVGDAVRGNAAETTTPAGAAAGPVLASQHRHLVPINYCAVCPLFWGELRASAQCQPATPQQSRSPVTMVYPVKVRERVFAEYLRNMSHSVQHGLQLDVLVPSSYSGRRAEVVGRSIVRLDDLVTYSQLSGWFTVAHYRSAAAVVATAQKKQQQHEAGEKACTAAATDEEQQQQQQQQQQQRATFVVIGKMKLHMQLVYFATPMRRTVRRVHGKTAADATPAHTRHVVTGAATTTTSASAVATRRGSSNSSAGVMTVTTPTMRTPLHLRQQQQQQQHVDTLTPTHAPTTSAPYTRTSPAATPNPLTTPTAAVATTAAAAAGDSGKDDNKVNDERQRMREEAAETRAPPTATMTATAQLPCPCSSVAADATTTSTEATTTAASTTTSMALHALLRTSARLRDEMAAEAARVQQQRRRHNTDDGSDDSPPRALPAPSPHDKDDDTQASDADDDDSDNDDNNNNNMDDEEDVYTSECSDKEERLLAMHTQPTRHKGEQRKRRPQEQQHKSAPAPLSSMTVAEASPRTTTVTAALAAAPAASMRCTQPTLIELSLDNFAFARTAAMSHMRAMRVHVRLSSDMTTDTPTAGPYSSYVHRLPLTQRAICLRFAVCSYSSQDSRLVIELYTVASQAHGTHAQSARQRRTHVMGDVHSQDDVADEERDSDRGGDVVAAERQQREDEEQEQLLGLCIVGVYTQSREVVLRDCVHNVVNATAHLDLQLRPCAQRTSNALPLRDDGTTRRHRRRRSAHGGVSRQHAHVRSKRSSSSSSDSSSMQRQRAAQTRSAAALHTPPPAATRQHARDRRRRSKTLAAPPAAVAASKHPHRQAASTPDNNTALWHTHAATTTTAAATATRRLGVRIAVVSAKELPHVTVYTGADSVYAMHSRSNSSYASGGRSSSSSRTMAEQQQQHLRDKYVAPNSFVVVEDIYSGLDDRHANTAPVSEWYVQRYEHGCHDRTAVIASSTCPVYNYVCIASLPRESVYLRQQEQTPQHDTAAARTLSALSTDTVAAVAAPRPCLRELVLTMWHKMSSNTTDVNDDDSDKGTNTNNNDEETAAFWSSTAYMGEVRIDLRPLRYLTQLDGYYRVVATDKTPAGGQAALTAVPGQTIGYVRVCVALQSA